MEIVFIDDQEEMCEFFGFLLEDFLGFKTQSFTELDPAREYIENNSNNDLLVICDYQLGQGNGLDFYLEVSQKQIPFLLVTGMIFDDGDAKVKKILDDPKSEILYKPLNEDVLKAKIEQLKAA